MTKEEAAVDLETIFALAKRRGFFWPAYEIYGGVSGLFDYGPMGKLMKNRLEIYLRKKFRKNGFWEVQCPLIGPKIVWEASGHVERFFDHIVQCTNLKWTP